MAESHESLSKQSRRRTSWLFAVLGLIILILFLMVLCSSKEEKVTQEAPSDEPRGLIVAPTIPNGESDLPDLPQFETKGAQLIVTPTEVELNNVVLGGAPAEGIITLRAEKGPVKIEKKSLAETTNEGFTLEGDCMQRTQLDEDEECTLKVLWTPTVVQTLQNTLTITWREDSHRDYTNQRSQVQLRASSTDSKECVCCEVEKEKTPKEPRKVISIGGKIYTIDENGNIIDENGNIIMKADAYKQVGDAVFDTDGNLLFVLEPKKVALGLNNEYLGLVTDTRTVIDKDGKTLGRLLGDDTLVDPDLNVLGAALPIVSVIDAQGKAIGKMKVDEKGVPIIGDDGVLYVVDAKNIEIGMVRVDKTVVDKAGIQIGMLRPWGITLDLSGDFLGVILPDGQVVDAQAQPVGFVQQNGFVLSEKGVLVGGVVPVGMVVGAGCTSYGVAGFDGKVKDVYGQIVGRVMLDGGVVDSKFNEIGRVVNQGLIVDMKGQILGFVNSEGKGVDRKGMLMGCVAPNGTVAAGKKMLGAVLQKGMVVANSCTVVGSTYPNGHVMSHTMQDMGVVRADGFAINTSNKVIGAVVPRGTVMGQACHLVGVISVTGRILNEQNMPVGCIDMQRRALDSEGREIGKMTLTGPVIAADGTVVGRARYDGKIVDKEGKVIDCENPDGPTAIGTISDVTATTNQVGSSSGVIKDDKGNATSWSVLANRVYTEKGDEIGTIDLYRLVSNADGRLIGFIPPDGVILSGSGEVLGTYNRLMGTALNMKGEDLGYVMPDLTVLDLKKAKVLGALLPQDTVFVNLNGEFLGRLTLDGQVLNGEGQSVGRPLADGSLYAANNVLIGGAVASGLVFSADGNQAGIATANGDVMSKGTRIANLLPNGLAVTPDSRVVGHIWKPLSVAVGAQGVVGTVVSRARGQDKTVYQASVFKKNGEYAGVMSPFGVLLGTNGELGGIAAPITMVVDVNNNFIGWVDFKGQVINSEENVIGLLMPNNLVMNSEGKVIGSIMEKGTVVDSSGAYVGHIGPDGKIYNGAGIVDLKRSAGDYFFNKDLSRTAHILHDGLAITSVGKVLGWTGFDGRIMDSKRDIGRVSLDNNVLGENGQILASYVGLGAPSVHEKERMVGIVDESGSVITTNGRNLGTVLAPDYAVRNNIIVGRILSQSLFARNLIDDELVGVTGLDSVLYKPNTARQTGSLMMNGLVADGSKKIVGGLVRQGFATATNLKSLGEEDFTGVIWLGGKRIGTVRGNGIIVQNSVVSGGIVVPDAIIDKNGAEVGHTSSLAAVVDKNGNRIASRMPFYSVLTPETLWAGGPIRTGMVIDDRARKIGVVAGDGSMIEDGAFKGRVLPDGSVAGVIDRAVYNAMPYIGHLAVQGLPVRYEGDVLGRTTVQGDVVDASDKVIYNTLDDGSIRGKERVLEGRVLPFVAAISRHNSVLGLLNGDGKVIDASGNEVGRVATNGAVKGGTEMEILGALIPETLVVNDCKVLGQVSYDGTVVDGKGNVIGRVQMGGWVEDSTGRQIGRAVTYGPIMSSSTPPVYLGRTLPDSTLVDPSGVVVGCVRNNGEAVAIESFNPDGTPNIGENPKKIGHQVKRGPVVNSEGKMVGSVTSTGQVMSATGESIGYIKGDGSNKAFTFAHEEIGRAVSEFEELIFDPENGQIIATFDQEGVRRDPMGDFLWKVLSDGRIVDEFGNEIAKIGDSSGYAFLYNMEKQPVARLNECVLNKLPGKEKMGTLLANGDIRDDEQTLILTATIDKKVFNPDGTQFGYFDGVEVDLRRCGLSEKNLSTASRKIKWGGKTYEIDPATGMIIDPATGNVVGIWDDVNKSPYFWDVNKQGELERPAPPPAPKIVVPQETIDVITENLNKRRTQMKERMGGSSVIKPAYNIEQLAQSGKSSDWSSVGVSKSNISTWPVDMSRVILADKAIPAVLQRSIDSRYPNVPVTAIVERHIYGEAGRNILIPAGSRLIGRATSSTGRFGSDQAAKIDITWTRLIRPDGAAFKFDAISGDAQGRGGVAAYLDLQLLKKFGLPFVSTIGEGLILKLTELNEKQVVSGTSSGGGDSKISETPAHQTRKMFIDNFKEMWNELMDMAGEIPNIVYVPAGTRLVAFSNEDLWLRSDDDPGEKPSEQTVRYSPGPTSNGNNGSWTSERSGKNESENNSSTSSTEQKPASDAEKVYEPREEQQPLPSDLENREVRPVTPQREEKPAYF